MNVNRFLFQVQRNLPKHKGVITWIEDSALKVGCGDTESFEIRYPGGICYNAATELLMLNFEVKKNWKMPKSANRNLDNQCNLEGGFVKCKKEQEY